MLSDQSLEIAHRIVTQLKQKGITLTPRAGTPVALLASSLPTMPNNLLPGQYVDVIAKDAQSHGALAGADSLHDEKMEWCVGLIFKGVSADLEMAKNVIQPIIDNLADNVEKDLTEACSDRAHGYEIVTEDLPRLFMDQKIENLFERYKDIKPMPMASLNIFPQLPLEDIRRRLNTGDDELNELIAEVVDIDTVEDLKSFYEWSFCSNGSDRIDFSNQTRWHSPVMLIVLYFLTIGLEADLPDGVNGSLATVTNYLKNLRGMTGAAIYRQLKQMERTIENKELIRTVSVVGDDVKVYVNKSVYDTFLDEGGSAETILGAVCGKSSFSYNVLLDTKVKLEKQWCAFVEALKARNDANKLSLIVTSIRKTLSQHIDEMEVIPNGSGTKAEMQNRLRISTKNLYLPDVDKLQYSLKNIVFLSIFPEQHNARYILDSLDKQECDGEVGKLATTVVMALVSDWLVKNVEVTVGNVKV